MKHKNTRQGSMYEILSNLAQKACINIFYTPVVDHRFLAQLIIDFSAALYVPFPSRSETPGGLALQLFHKRDSPLGTRPALSVNATEICTLNNTKLYTIYLGMR